MIEGLSKEAVEEQAQKETSGVRFTVTGEGDSVLVQAKGTTAHASLPETGNNALTGLLSLLDHLPLAPSRSRDVIHGLCQLFPHGDTCGKAAGVFQEDEESGALTLAFSILHMTDEGVMLNMDIRSPMCANETNVRDVLVEQFASLGLHMEKEPMNPPTM